MVKLQCSTKVVETHLEDDTFQFKHLFYFICLKIPLAPSSMLHRRCSLCSLRNRKIQHCWEKEGNCFQDTRKLHFTAKCLNTFVTHCGGIGQNHFYIFTTPDNLQYRLALNETCARSNFFLLARRQREYQL